MRARETKEGWFCRFFLSREREPTIARSPTCLLKKNEKKEIFLGPNNRRTKKLIREKEKREKKSAQIPKKKAAFFKSLCPSEGGPLPYLHQSCSFSLCLSLSATTRAGEEGAFLGKRERIRERERFVIKFFS